jgi:hypothetical protein
MVDATHVSVDLDGIACYHAIHGLPPPAAAVRDIALVRWLPRFLELFATLGVRATFFVIGAELERALADDGPGARHLQQALAEGHELGNHSWAHAYDMVRRDDAEQRDDITACDRLLRDLGATPVGFRAPGYTHDARLLAAVASAGYRYDSSALPSPTYWAAKVAAIGWHRLLGRRSQSMVRGAASFFGSGEPHVDAASGLVSLPITTLGALRLPLVGTFVLAGPRWVRNALVAGAAKRASVHLELHAIDLVDEESDGIDDRLARLQPELRTPLVVRRERLADFLRSRSDFECLRDSASRVRASSG